MGMSYEFGCAACDYTADVCGGPDTGMLVSVNTVTCFTCAELVDVVTARHDWSSSTPPESDLTDGRCPRCGGANLVSWGPRQPETAQVNIDITELDDCGPCPKCGAAMRFTGGGIVTLWD